MPFVSCAISAIIGYLLGSIQSAVFISRVAKKPDIRTQGSGNAGSTNMLRVYGTKAGLLTLVCDLTKGVIAVLMGYLIGSWGSQHANLCGCIAGLAVVLGHVFPVFFNFRGGKGVATAMGALWVLSPFPVGLITTVLGVVMVAITGYVSAGSLGATVVLIITTLIFEIGNIPLLVFALAITILLTIRHVDNISRIIKGNERKIKFRKKDKDDI